MVLNPNNDNLSLTFRSFLPVVILFFIYLSATFGYTYAHVSNFDVNDPATGGNDGDVAQYIRMHEGASLESVPKPFRYRILTPYLARLVPFLPEPLLEFYGVDPIKIVKFKFAVINSTGLALTAVLLFYWCTLLGFSIHESIISGFIFLTCFMVENYGSLPLVDAISYFFLMSCLILVFTKKYYSLFIFFIFGMLAKETTLLVIFAIFLFNIKPKEKFLSLIACTPGLAIYIIFRLYLFPTEYGYNYSIDTALKTLLGIFKPNKYWLFMAIDFFETYGFFWILAVYGFIKSKSEQNLLFYRLSLLIPVIFIVPFLIRSNYGRVWFYTFPIIIPMIVLGFRHLIHRLKFSFSPT